MHRSQCFASPVSISGKIKKYLILRNLIGLPDVHPFLTFALVKVSSGERDCSEECIER